MYKTMSDEERFKIRRLCSGHYLCVMWPDNWDSMDDSDQEEFMLSNAWEPFQYWPVDEVYSIIDSAASMMINYIECNYINVHAANCGVWSFEDSCSCHMRGRG